MKMRATIAFLLSSCLCMPAIAEAPAWNFVLKAYQAGLPAMPPKARQDDVSGFVTIATLVDAEGYPLNPHVVEAEPVGYFETVALKRFERRWRFRPTNLPRCALVEARVTFRFDHESTGFPVEMDPIEARLVRSKADVPLPALDIAADPLGKFVASWAARGDWPRPPELNGRLPRGSALLEFDASVGDDDPGVVASSSQSLAEALRAQLGGWQPGNEGSACLVVHVS